MTANEVNPVKPYVDLGRSQLKVSRVGLGLWPIAGMTSLNVNNEDSLATIKTALEGGVNFFDTAFCYGADGISERLLGEAVAGVRDQVVVATKCGVHWAADLSRVNDASPRRLIWECDESLRRLQMDHVDLLYLHSPDRVTPIEQSAETLLQLKTSGKTLAVGISNSTFAETQAFHAVCPLTAVQPRYNMLQRGIEKDLVPWCLRENIGIVGYWPMMKGLLAGKMRRSYTFDPNDKRLTYEEFQSPKWDRAQTLLDELEKIALEQNITIAQLVVAWTLAQPGITATLCGAKRSWQIAETLTAMRITLTPEVLLKINNAMTESGCQIS